MQQIQNGIVAAFLVACWGIDAHTARHTQGLAVIPYLMDIAMGYIVILIEITTVALFLTYNKGTHETAHIPASMPVGRVLQLYPIGIEPIAVQLRSKRLCGECPDAILTFCHLLAVTVYAVAHHLNFLCSRGTQTKGYGSVIVLLG